jgi:hypothetical protein
VGKPLEKRLIERPTRCGDRINTGVREVAATSMIKVTNEQCSQVKTCINGLQFFIQFIPGLQMNGQKSMLNHIHKSVPEMPIFSLHCTKSSLKDITRFLECLEDCNPLL